MRMSVNQKIAYCKARHRVVLCNTVVWYCITGTSSTLWCFGVLFALCPLFLCGRICRMKNARNEFSFFSGLSFSQKSEISPPLLSSPLLSSPLLSSPLRDEERANRNLAKDTCTFVSCLLQHLHEGGLMWEKSESSRMNHERR